MRETAKWADGWLPVSNGPEDLARDLVELGKLCEAEGRDLADLDITLMAGIEEETPADQVSALFDAGATRVILAVGIATTRHTTIEHDGAPPLGPERYRDCLARLAERFLGA
jgi:alkanesulfonate monooxygenase SsuD/methylene tetrahydromethanopterin reductase-like flavin-dependent oxidoreductase (luciferase family)